jgi:parallel beta-helix repeat protein
MARIKLAFLLALAVSSQAWAGTGAARSPQVTHTYRRPATPTAFYQPPTTNVRFVAPQGNDTTGTGSETAPYRTLGKALQVVNDMDDDLRHWTIVMKAGTYREGELTVYSPNVTIQRYRDDLVSLRGSVEQTGFTGTGPYRKTLTSPDPTPLEQDCADTHLLGSNTQDHGAQFALAVFRAGVPLRRVRGPTVLSGEYAYNHRSNVLTLADSPTEIEVTSKRWALRSSASNVKLAGLDIQGYATCTVDWKKTVNGTDYFKGAVLLHDSASGAVLENSTVANNAGSAVWVSKARNVRLSGNTIVNNGWTGVHAADAPGLVVDNNTISFNNVRRWRNAVEAGMKITFIKDGVISNNLFEHNAATGFWCDQGCGSMNPSANWFIVARNLVRYNDSKGLFYEVSHHGVIASNVVHDNGESGIAAFGSRNVEIWNNTVVDNNASAEGYTGNVSVADDRRCFLDDTLPGGARCTVENGCDPRREGNNDHCEPSSVGHLANTCNAEHVRIMNNIISGSRGTRPLLNVEDPNPTAYGADLIVEANDYQAYDRPSTSAPASLIDWQRDAGSAAIAYPSLSAFQTENRCRESHSVERSGEGTPSYFIDHAGRNLAQNPASVDVWGRGATLPLEVLKAIYWPQTAPVQPSPRIGAIEWHGKASAG